ncbi:MAG: glycoside hydrolase family 3 C-terminal domain-containing protein [Lachnospiraceae bacterium]|nr:glycoside hydrolase family 3 C-terminal domain-containing protein [Lachnospiraceae bacterium]
MALEDKISLCTGADFWHSKKMEQYGIPAFTMSDGPHGLRYQSGEADMIGVNVSSPATCFPTAVTAGASWNPELYAEEGKAIGEEAVKYGVDVVLGPGCNIKRNPLCGRNFEYLSEDPYAAGKMAAAFIEGQQSAGVSSCLKHFAANNQEYKRQNGDSQVDDRAMREIYLATFETAVKEGKPGTVMCSYNKINGVHASDNRWLLTKVLRKEWGFSGMVVTDWGALCDRIKAYRAGCDLNMPGGSKYMEKEALKAVKNGALSESDIDAAVERIVRLALQSAETQKGGDFDADAHDKLACRIAEQGAVLLKNESHLLPVKEEEIVLIGDMAKNFRYQGAGSSHINPTKLTSLTDALPKVPHLACCDADGNVTEEALREAAKAAGKAKTAVVVAGLPDSYESEGFDRENMKMPDGHNRMIEAVAAANPDTVVVLLGGSVMELPWFDKVKAILYMGLSGQAGGLACANLLTGKANPGGRLTETWPLHYEDVISKDTFGKRNAEYRESIYVGYRYYEKAHAAVRFPFGYGLSYTEFAYSDLQIQDRTVTATVTNTGGAAGAEVVQLYIAPPQNGIHRPAKELKGFVRVELQPGESRQVTFLLDDRSFAVWADGWKVPGGSYEVLLAASSEDIRLRGSIEIAGEAVKIPKWQKGSWYETLSGNPTREEWEKAMGHSVAIVPEAKKGQFTMDNSCLEMKNSSFIMKIQYKVMENIIAKSFGGKKDYSDPAFKRMMVCAADCPLRAMVISSGGAVSDSLAQGLLEMANGHYIRGIKAMLKK